MNKKISAAVIIIIMFLITIIAEIIIWLNQKEFLQVVQNIIPPTVEQDIKKDVSETIKKRFSGTDCYLKEYDGTDNQYELSKNFNLSNPSTKVTYSNQEKGISFEIPYNPNWGNKNCKVEPYVEFTHPGGDVLLEFGKPRAWVTSEFQLTIFNNRSAQDIINEQKNVGGEPDPNPRKITLGNNQLIVYESYGMTTERIYELIGKKYNYAFGYSETGNINEKIAKELEAIIQNAKIE